MLRSLFVCFICAATFLLVGCGFQLQGAKQLAPPLQRMYLQTPDPYGSFARNLIDYLHVSHVELVSTPLEASTILAILRDDTSQELLSVNATQQTRQYNLRVTITFQITDRNGRILVNPQTLTETRVTTIQSDQILGSSNETNLFYQQMRRTLAYALINRIASREISTLVINNSR